MSDGSGRDSYVTVNEGGRVKTEEMLFSSEIYVVTKNYQAYKTQAVLLTHHPKNKRLRDTEIINKGRMPIE